MTAIGADFFGSNGCNCTHRNGLSGCSPPRRASRNSNLATIPLYKVNSKHKNAFTVGGPHRTLLMKLIMLLKGFEGPLRGSEGVWRREGKEQREGRRRERSRDLHPETK